MDTLNKTSLFNLSIRNRLISGFLMLAIPLFIVMLISVLTVNHALKSTTQIMAEDRPLLNANQNVDDSLLTSQRHVYQWILFGNEDTKIRYNKLRAEMRDQVTNMDKLMEGNRYPQEISTLWNAFRAKYASVFENQEALLNLPASRTSILTDEQAKLLQHSKEQVDEMVDLQANLSDKISHLFFEDAKKLESLLFVLRNLSYGLIILAVFLTILVPFYTARAIVTPLNKAISIAQEIAAGKRQLTISSRRRDEVGLLLGALKTMHEAIYDNENKLIASEEQTRELFDTMVKIAKQYSEHSSKVATGDFSSRISVEEGGPMEQLGHDLNTMTNGLAAMTENVSVNSLKIIKIVESIKASMSEQSSSISEQAAAINEISASLEEIDKSSKRTMEKAQTLRDAAKTTLAEGNKGKESVQQAINGMGTLREQVNIIEKTIIELSLQTSQISEITAAVTTLAQQSKMLALNASIEAAKAGESGKGFAVVANEVKILAEQSERATTQVQKILSEIKHSTDKAVNVTEEGTKTVDAGAALITNTAEVINHLSELINTASVMSQQMEAAIRQEGIGIDQITSGMNEINTASASFETGIKQTSLVIDQLAEVSANLKKDLNVYKI